MAQGRNSVFNKPTPTPKAVAKPVITVVQQKSIQTPVGTQRAQAIKTGPSAKPSYTPVVQPTSSSSGRAPSVAPRVPSQLPSTTPVSITTPSATSRIVNVSSPSKISTPVRVSAPTPRISSVPKPSPVINPILAPIQRTQPTTVTKQQDIQNRQLVVQQTQQNQQKLQQQGLAGGFKSVEDQLKGLTSILNPPKIQKAYAEPAPKPIVGVAKSSLIGPQKPQGQFLTPASLYGQTETKPEQQPSDLISRVTGTQDFLASPPQQRLKVNENVEVGGGGFFAGVTTAEKTSKTTPKPLPLVGQLPSPTKESRKETLMQQRSGDPLQVSLGSIASERLANDMILGRGEKIGTTEKVLDSSGKIISKKGTSAIGLENQVNLAQRREQDVFRVINVVQEDIVRPLNVRPSDNKGSPQQAIEFLEARSTGKTKSPNVVTRFGEGVGVLGFDYKDEVGSVYGTVGSIGSAGFEDFGLTRPSTRGALKTPEGRIAIEKTLSSQADYSLYESLGFKQPAKATGELIVTTDRPLGETAKPIPRNVKVPTNEQQSIGGLPFLTPASLITGEQAYIGPTQPKKSSSKIQQQLALGSLFPSVPQAFGEESQIKQIMPDTRKGAKEPAPLPKGSKSQQYNPYSPEPAPLIKSKSKGVSNAFSPDANYKDTSGVGEFFANVGKQSGVSNAVGQIKEYGTGFGESLQNELINIQNLGSFATQGEIPEKQTFQTPSEQVFAGVIGGAVKQATGQGSFVESASKGFEGAGKTLQERPAYGAGDITAQGLLFLPAGIYKAGSFGVKAISGFGKALTGVKTAVKAVPKTIAGKVGSIQTRAIQSEIKLNKAFQEDINPASFYTAKSTVIPKVTRKIYPKKPTEQDYSQAFARERAFTTEEGSVTSIPRGKIKPAKPTEQDYSQAFASERAFAEEIPRGTKAPSRVKSPTGRVDPLERVQQTTAGENLRAFRESEKIGSVFGKSPIRDLPIGQADIGFPFASLGRSSVEGIIARGGRASTTPLGLGTGRLIKGGSKYKQFGKTAPTDDFTKITEGVYGAENLGKAGKVAKGASEADDISRFTKAEKGAGEGGEFFSGGRGLKLLEKEKPPKIRAKAKGAEDAFPEELRGLGKEKLPKGKAPSKLRGGLLPIAGLGTTAGITAGLIPDVRADTGQKGNAGQREDLFFREATIQTQNPFQAERTGTRQKPSAKERTIQKTRAEEQYQYKNIFETPTVQRARAVQTPALKERLRQENIFGYPEEVPRGRGGGGFFAFGGNESGGGLSQGSRKFYRVFDVAKTPFGRVERGLGVQVQSDAPIYEVSDVAGKSPMFNITEKYFSGDQVGKTRRKLKAGKNPLLDENFFG